MNKRRCNVYFSCKKRHTLGKKQLMVNNLGIIIHKTDYKKKEENMTIYSIYKKNHPVTTKQILNVFDLGYLGVEKDFPEQLLSALPCKKKRNQQCLSHEEKEYNKIHSNKKRIVIQSILSAD
jgi:hypothetical protein